MKTARDLLIEKLREIGADGLYWIYNHEECCGCGLDDLSPLECLDLEYCVPAKWIARNDESCAKRECEYDSCDSRIGCFVPLEEVKA